MKKEIKNAFERSAEIDANNITVMTDGHTVTLRGLPLPASVFCTKYLSSFL